MYVMYIVHTCNDIVHVYNDIVHVCNDILHVFNSLTLRAAKTGKTILEIFHLLKHFQKKTFEGEMLIRS